MKYLGAVWLGCLFVSNALANDSAVNESKIKSWQVYQNDYGYELKYPDCWELRPDNPDEADKVSSAGKDIAVDEGKRCARTRMDNSTPNGISISAGWEATTKAETKKFFDRMDKVDGPIAVQRGDYRVYKHLKVDGGGELEAYVTYEKEPAGYIRWEFRLYCPTSLISLTGPAVSLPATEYLEKFKKGDLALPEPEKTIIESLKCIKPRKPSLRPKKQ